VAANTASTLPEFADPPVNETVLSIQFAPISGFGIPHLGLYWARIREAFGRFEVQPALASVTEQFGEPIAIHRTRIGIQLLQQPDVRCWFLDASGCRMLQVQRDRFIHNWRQVTGEEQYPRYPSVRQTLETEWARFCDFLHSEKLGAPSVNQCEVTYVNHLEYGRGWKGYGELAKALAAWSGEGSDHFLPAPERASMELHYGLPNDAGRLHISVEPVIRRRDSKEILQLALTARGAPRSSSASDIFAWMDLGREWVVRGFADFTTSTMHRLWGRKS
jgi:uncharacterized protein (TIGR04255 family)